MKHRCCGGFSLFQCICCLVGRSRRWSSSVFVRGKKAGWSHFTALTICLQRSPVPWGCGEMNIGCCWSSRRSFSATSRSHRGNNHISLITWGQGGRGASLSLPQGLSVCLSVSQTDTCPLFHQHGPQQFSNCQNPRSSLFSLTPRVPSRPLGTSALWQRGDSLGFACARARPASPLPSCVIPVVLCDLSCVP